MFPSECFTSVRFRNGLLLTACVRCLLPAGGDQSIDYKLVYCYKDRGLASRANQEPAREANWLIHSGYYVPRVSFLPKGSRTTQPDITVRLYESQVSSLGSNALTESSYFFIVIYFNLLPTKSWKTRNAGTIGPSCSKDLAYIFHAGHEQLPVNQSRLVVAVSGLDNCDRGRAGWLIMSWANSQTETLE